MTVLQIRTLPDPVLRQKARKVKTIDASVRKLIDDMLETLHADPNRLGLAAPQVGVPLRVIVIGMPEQEDIILINPEIVRQSGVRLVSEACLSVPGYAGQVQRALKVTAKGRNREGVEVRIKAEDLLAQALEHEINHLNGVLYVDQLVGMDEPYKVQPKETPAEPVSSELKKVKRTPASKPAAGEKTGGSPG